MYTVTEIAGYLKILQLLLLPAKSKFSLRDGICKTESLAELRPKKNPASSLSWEFQSNQLER